MKMASYTKTVELTEVRFLLIPQDESLGNPSVLVRFIDGGFEMGVKQWNCRVDMPLHEFLNIVQLQPKWLKIISDCISPESFEYHLSRAQITERTQSAMA